MGQAAFPITYEEPTTAFTEDEIIIKDTICSEQKQKEEVSLGIGEEISEVEVTTEIETSGEIEVIGGIKDKLKIRFKIPKGKVSDIMRMMNFIQSKFETLEIELLAQDGKISEQDYENIIKETFRQLGIDVENFQ